MKKFFWRLLAAYVALATVLVAASLIGPLFSDTLTIPYKNKQEGDVIYASQWSANFQAIEDVVNDLDDDNFRALGMDASTKLANLSVTLGKMALDSVDTTKIVDETIESDDILDGGIATADLADDAITGPKIGTTRYVTNFAAGTATPGTVLAQTDTLIVSDTFTTNANTSEVAATISVELECTGVVTQVELGFFYNCGALTEVGNSLLDYVTTLNYHTFTGVWTSTAHLSSTSCSFSFYARRVAAGATCYAQTYSYQITEYSD
jgi:hypothetical protein